MTNRSGRIQIGQKNDFIFIYLLYYYFIIYSDHNTKRPGFGLGFCQALGLAMKIFAKVHRAH